MLQWMKKPVRGGLKKGFINGTIIFKIVYLHRNNSLEFIVGKLHLKLLHLPKYF